MDRYEIFASRRFSRCFVHKKIFELIWEVVFKLEYFFVKYTTLKCPYSVRMRENTDHSNSEYEHFLLSGNY